MANGNGSGNGNGGNGRDRGVWASVTPAAVVFLLLGGIASVLVSGFTTDRAEQWDAIHQTRADLLAALGKVTEGNDSIYALIERIKHVEGLATANTARTEAAYRELDDKLQRELNLADAKLLTQIENLDRRLQSEIANNANSVISISEAIREIRANSWTRADHRDFQDRAGITLDWPESSRTPREQPR